MYYLIQCQVSDGHDTAIGGQNKMMHEQSYTCSSFEALNLLTVSTTWDPFRANTSYRAKI
jgi:hypothetical protein